MYEVKEERLLSMCLWRCVDGDSGSPTTELIERTKEQMVENLLKNLRGFLLCCSSLLNLFRSLIRLTKK